MAKTTGKTGGATPAKTVLETVSSTPATVGVVVPSAITKKMSIPELMAVMAPAAAEYNQCIGAVINNEGTARRLEKDVLYPGLLRYREWIKSTPVAERKQVTEHYTLTKYVKFLGVGESLLRLWEFRDKHKKLGTEVLRLQQEGQGNGNKGGNKGGGSKNDTGKLEDEQKEKERREREQATAKLLRQQAEAEQALKNAEVDLASAEHYATDNPADADPAELEAAQAKYTAAHAACEDAAEAIAVLEQTPTHEAPSDSDTMLSDSTQTMKDKAQESVESEVLNPDKPKTLLPGDPGYVSADGLTTEQRKQKVVDDNKVAQRTNALNFATTVVSNYVWLVRDAGAWLIVIAYTEAEAMAMMEGAESATHVKVPILARGVAHGDMLYTDGDRIKVDDAMDLLKHAADNDDALNMDAATGHMSPALKLA